MRVLALDYGSARCGCAISDPTGTVVRPLPALEAPEPAIVASIAREHEVDAVVVGMPVGLSGEEGGQAALTREFADALGALVNVPVETWDERFTTTMAERTAREGATADPDSLAAAHLLESYLHSIADPFLSEDPEARERERRWREREARRRTREQRDAPPPPQPPPSEPVEDLSPAVEEDSDDREEWAPRRNWSAPRPPRLRELSLPRRPLVWAGVVAAALFLWFLIALFQPFAGDGEGEVVVTIPRGATLGEIADLLDERGIISSATLFELRVTLAGRRSDLLAGTYTLAGGMSYSSALDRLTTPPGERTITISIPEGSGREEIARLAVKAGIEGSYARASRRSDALDPARYEADDPDSLEGFLFPATYELPVDADARDLVSDQLEAFRRNFDQVSMRQARERGLTPYEVLTLASMIEREVMVDSERRLVSAVIYNRLADGEPLGIDATIRYATGNYDRPLRESELAIDSPYNSYINAGLPPTPIGNPGLAAIEAAAKPADVDYRYFVVKPGTCGEHDFSTTAAEHDAAVARYNTAREAAGGKSPVDCPG